MNRWRVLVGFVFQTNPRGAMRDAAFSVPETVDDNWNGIWEVATTRDSAGWTAEFRIPFRTLLLWSTGARVAGSTLDGRAGIDMKIAATPTMTGDITVHTDFSQVEADQPLINLTRFPLFFPEKREFFIESNDLFAFGGLITATGDDVAVLSRPY